MIGKVAGTFAVIALLSFGSGEHSTFSSGGNTLAGYYQSPAKKAKGVVLFVHGDGERNYDADGYYSPIWEVLNDKGYAVFSWDKPGVGDSSGNWLEQSMADRQNEVLAAIAHVKKNYGYKAGQIGLMGFSQAGWVAPAVAVKSQDVRFLIGVGYAINWLDQSWYLTKSRLLARGSVSARKLSAARQKHLQERQFWQGAAPYEDYIRSYNDGDRSLTQVRYGFIKKNVFADALADYKQLDKPTFIALGAKDRNVDVAHTEKVLSRVFRNRSNLRVVVIPDATHSLLKEQEFGQLSHSLRFWLKLLWQGQDAFAPPFLEQLKRWLDQLDRDKS